MLPSAQKPDEYTQLTTSRGFVTLPGSELIREK